MYKMYKMKLHIEVISEEVLKPSTLTADRLRNYRMSYLDQLNPSIYNHMVYFYPKTYNTEAEKVTISDQLKQSICNTLTYFYPLAGRLKKDQSLVDCNDEGIPFVEVRVNCKLSDVLDNPVLKELNKFLPFEIHAHNEILLGIQFNVFECGGIGIGVCVSHKISDALSFFSFVNMWAAIARGDDQTKLIAPNLESASIFPPQDLSGYITTITELKNEHVITKRFVFNATKVEEIRRKYGEKVNQTRPTRVEALSSFIWDRLVTALGLRSKPDTLYTIAHLVNIRGRIEPPLPESAFGNIFSMARTIPTMDSDIVTQMRESIKTVNKEHVKKIQSGYNHYDQFKDIREKYWKSEVVGFGITSLCRFPIYEADFGWGKPIWVASADREIKNTIVFMDAVNNGGIEAWVTLDEEEMANFDSDEQLLTYVNASKSV